ncbi:heterokaryon incompatibility protein-domain-containing protein [Exophiala viscosa]|uniref:Heterokaryon incompatibility protein-domain-containing protein n=1 Tax=Exophiala viscosa TaxID=2486360 RepID=A0AAN6E5S1_9EURO|nr:heterokaryon incompatibility protein-domain-containing protein [Exophiala viscosa]
MDSQSVLATITARTSTCPNCRDERKDKKHEKRSFDEMQSYGTTCHRCYVILQGVQALREKFGHSTKNTWKSRSRIDIGRLRKDLVGVHSTDETGRLDLNAVFYTCLDDASEKNAWPRTKWHSRPCGPSPAISLQFAQQALGHCTENHDCQPRAGPLPKRLLDVQDPSIGEDVLRVVQSERLPNPDTVHYVALSYCWGKISRFKDGMLKLSKEDLAEKEHGLDLVSLPAAFQDAVKTTRGLGLRYLWIDALCIAQGDPEERSTELLKMAKTYSRAFVTIAADASLSCEESFLDTQTYRRLSDGIEVPGSYGGPRIFVRVDEPSLYRNCDRIGFPSIESVMETRGWTFQEGLLSRRVLSFRHIHMHFRCMQSTRTEYGNSFGDSSAIYIPHGEREITVPSWVNTVRKRDTTESSWREMMCSPSALPLGADKLLDLWYQVLLSYTPRELTRIDDRLEAIDGVASVLRSRAAANNDYLAGLWKDSFVEQLDWIRDGFQSAGETYQHLAKAPSWSWGSLTGKIPNEYLSGSLDKAYHTKLVQSPSRCDDFDGTRCGPAVVEGPLSDATIDLSSITPAYLKYFVKRSHFELFLDTPLEVVPFPCSSGVTLRRSRLDGIISRHWSGGQAHIYLLNIYTDNDKACFLLLTQSPENKEQYSRIGVWKPPLIEGMYPVEALRHDNQKIPRQFVEKLPVRRISLI